MGMFDFSEKSDQGQKRCPMMDGAKFSEAIARHCHERGRGVDLRVFGTVVPANGSRRARPQQNPDDWIGSLVWFPRLDPSPSTVADPAGGRDPYHIKVFLNSESAHEQLVERDGVDLSDGGSVYVEAVDKDETRILARTIVDLGSPKKAAGSNAMMPLRAGDPFEEKLKGTANRVQDMVLNKVVESLNLGDGEAAPSSTGGRPGRRQTSAPVREDMIPLPGGLFASPQWAAEQALQRNSELEKIRTELEALKGQQQQDQWWQKQIDTYGPMIFPTLVQRLLGGGAGAPSMAQMEQMAQSMGLPPNALRSMMQSMGGGGGMPMMPMQPRQPQPMQPMSPQTTGRSAPINFGSHRAVQSTVAGPPMAPMAAPMRSSIGSLGMNDAAAAAAAANESTEAGGFDDSRWSEQDENAIDKMQPVAAQLFEALHPQLEQLMAGKDVVADLRNSCLSLLPNLAKEEKVSTFWLRQLSKTPAKLAAYMVEGIRRELPGMLQDGHEVAVEGFLTSLIPQIQWA